MLNSMENQTLVVPFDFSNASRRAVERVLEWAHETTSIHLVFIVEPTLSFISLDTAMPVPPSYDNETHDLALEKMKKLYPEEKYPGLNVHCTIGDPGMEIVSLAETNRANMIIMPSHGRSGLSRLFLGSVAERVLRLAHCPVLILRGKEFQYDEEQSAVASESKDAASMASKN